MRERERGVREKKRDRERGRLEWGANQESSGGIITIKAANRSKKRTFTSPLSQASRSVINFNNGGAMPLMIFSARGAITLLKEEKPLEATALAISSV